MQAFPWTVLVTVAALAAYFAMSLRVGLARIKYNVQAPATTATRPSSGTSGST